MSTRQSSKKKKRRNWVPYLLILPSLIYILLFFAWPMARGLVLAIWDDEALLASTPNPNAIAQLTSEFPKGHT